MISFRFHVVSITAVFLAIAIGVVVGSTYVDRAIVDTLQNRIDTVSANLDERKAENDALEEDLDDARSYISASSDYAVTDRLAEVPVLIVALRGVEEAAVEDTVRLARQAGGLVPGVAWMEPRWALEEEADRGALAELVDASDTAEPEQMWDDAWDAVADELVVVPVDEEETPTNGAGATTTTTVPADAPEAPVLLGLAEAGFLTIDALDDDAVTLAEMAGSGARVLVVTGSEAAAELAPLVAIVVGATLGGGSVAAEVFVPQTDGPVRGQVLTDTIDQGTLETMAIVDAVDRVEGRVAAIVAVAGAPGVVVGHFGYGPDADAVLPVWSPP